MEEHIEYHYMYMFPEIEGAKGFTRQEQMAKINEEAYELQREILRDKNLQSRRRILFEGMNVIHAVETLFHVLDASEDELNDARQETIYENQLRGYYGKQQKEGC